jgi:rhamnogalacturonyl hydrolase YesR
MPERIVEDTTAMSVNLLNGVSVEAASIGSTVDKPATLRASPQPPSGYLLQFWDGNTWRELTSGIAWNRGASVTVRVQVKQNPQAASGAVSISWGEGKVVKAGRWTFTAATDGSLVARKAAKAPAARPSAPNLADSRWALAQLVEHWTSVSVSGTGIAPKELSGALKVGAALERAIGKVSASKLRAIAMYWTQPDVWPLLAGDTGTNGAPPRLTLAMLQAKRTASKATIPVRASYKSNGRALAGYALDALVNGKWSRVGQEFAWARQLPLTLRVRNVTTGAVSQSVSVAWPTDALRNRDFDVAGWRLQPKSDGRIEVSRAFVAGPVLLSRAAVDSQIKKVNSHWIARHSGPGEWPTGARGWARSVYHIGNLAAYASLKAASFLKHTAAQAKAFNWQINGGKHTGNADARAIGQVYLGLSRDPKSIADTKLQADASIDKDEYKRWTWIDAMFMEAANLAELGNRYPNDAHRYHEHLHKLFQYMRDDLKLFDPSLGLWYRDQRFAPGGELSQSPSGKPVLWSRGNGWVFSALARILEVLPKSAPGYGAYVNTFKTMANALRSRQRADGLWNSNLGDPKHAGGPESTGTSAFVYGMAVGLRLKLLDKKAFTPIVAKGWSGLTRVALQPDGLLGYCQPGGDRPRRPDARTTTDFGVGLFLLAGSAVSKIA